MATHDSNINIQVLADAPAVGRAGFGTPIVLDNALMAERVRYYTSAGQALADVGSAGITAAQAAAIGRGFAQQPHVARIGAGRITNPSAQVATITVGGTPASGEYSFGIDLGGSEVRYFSYTAVVPTDDNDDIASELYDGMLADSDLLAVATPVLLGPEITLTALSPNAGFDFVDGPNPLPVGATIDYVLITPGLSLASELQAVLDASSDWYGFSLVSRSTDLILAAADWTENSNRIFVAQSSDPAILGAGSADVASQLKAAGYNRTTLLYHHANSQYADMAWLAKKLAVNMDRDTSTWQYATLAGITVSPISETQKANLLGKNANVYLNFYGVGATSHGKMAGGRWIDTQVLVDWTRSRVEEAVAQLLLSEANANRRIPYTDEGLAQIEAVVMRVLLDGLRIGHFAYSANGFPPYVDMPAMSQIPDADKLARIVRFSFGAREAGAIGFVEGVGYITVSDETFERLVIQAGITEV